jgi:hypothetical protein
MSGKARVPSFRFPEPALWADAHKARPDILREVRHV